MQKLNWRIIHTHDTQSNWEKLDTFVPQCGELIVYDVDESCSYERFKIGDGVNLLKDLPFTIDAVIDSLFNNSDNTLYADAGRITDYEESVT